MKARRIIPLTLAMATLLSTSRAEKVTQKTLPNGLSWIHRQVVHNQIVAFYLYFPGGSLEEPADKAGLTSLMTSVMFKGTATRSARKIAEETEVIGASLDASGDEDFWQMTGQCTADRFEETLDIFQDILLNPVFAADEFEKEKAAQLNGIRAKDEQIFNVAYERFQTEIFGDHPYGRPAEGTLASVSALTREDLASWHRTRVNPKGAVLVTVGSIPTAKMEKTLKKTFESWAAGSSKRPAGPGRPRFPSAVKETREDRPFEQSYLMMGYPAPGVADKDYAAVKVINALLGSGMSSPLFQVVREEEGLAYEVSSFYSSRQLGSAFVIYAGTDPKNLEKAYRKIQKMIQEFLAKPVSPQALLDAKQYIRGHYMMDHQTNRSLARYLGWWEVLGQGHAYDGVYVNDVQTVTAEQVKDAAKRMFGQPATVVKILSKK